MKKLVKMVLSAWPVLRSICVGGCLVLGAGVATAAELPAGYTAVEYIESTKGGGQFIDTGYTANAQTKVVMDAVVPPRWEQNDRFGVLFGSRTMDVWAEKAFALQMCTGNSETLDTVRFVYNGEYRQDGGKPFPFGERVTVTCDGQHVEWTGSKAASVAFTADPLASSKSTLYIFADNTVADDGAKSETGLNPSVMQLYSFRITEGETLKRDFVPCVRLADAVAGLYDMVEGKFYGNAGSGGFATAESSLPFGRELASGTYEINESFAFVAPPMESALKIADGATVTLDIAAGVTVRVRGGDAFEVWGGGAGIEVPANATLKVTGAGQLVAYGGKGANGCDGMAGGNGSADEATGNFTSGAGGAGGWGGGGAGAGIGGKGGNGGGGGAGGASVTGYDWSYTDLAGNNGGYGGNGGNGGTCGAVSVEDAMTVFAYGGVAGAADGGAGGASGQLTWAEGSTYYFGGFGGGGGGSGEKGGAAQDIGGGGAGGFGGGGGGSGGYLSRFSWDTFSAQPAWGSGGRGVVDGAAGGATSGLFSGLHGASGARGGSGTLTVAAGAKVCAAEGRYSVGRLSETVEIFYDNGQLLSVSGGTSSPLSYSVVNSDTATFDNGKWYVVKGTVSRTNRILVSGAANLVLLHNSSLTVDCRGISSNKQYAPGIEVCDDNSLCLFGVESGFLVAMGSNTGAGIGTAKRLGDNGISNCNSCGSITSYGGTVTAIGGNGGAGIGGGYTGSGGTVTINGGTVTATGGDGVAGIGGGGRGADGSLTLGPRVFKVDDNHYREGVVVSFVIPSNIRVSSVEGAEKVGMAGDRYFAANLNPGHTLKFTFEVTDPACRLAGNASVTVGPIFCSHELNSSLLPYADEIVVESMDYTLSNGEVRCAKNVYPIHNQSEISILSQSWYRVTGNMTRSELTVIGEVNLILCDDAKLTVNGGVRVNYGNTLNIYVQSQGTGQLVANGQDGVSGIGGGFSGSGGTITINGGTVMAQGGKNGAGIGSGHWGDCGTVTINGGNVTATSGGGGAGIGGGYCGLGGTVTINGGTVMATGGEYGAGIGGGYSGAGGTVTINDGTVTARGGELAAGIGGGYRGAGATVTINGGSVKAATIQNAPTNAANAAVYCVTVNVEKGERLRVEGLKDYGTNDIFAIDGKVYLWLPNGIRTFTVDGEMVSANVNGANTTAVKGLLVVPGVTTSRYETAEAATNAMAAAVVAPSAEVAAALGSDAARATYRGMFGFDVVPTSDGKWSVAALLMPEPWTNVVLSAQAATRQIPVADIAALELGVETNVTVKGCGVPGFYYSLYSGSSVTNLTALASEYGRNVLCGQGSDMVFSGVVKPSDAAGFFTIGAKEIPGVAPSDAIHAPIFIPKIVEE